MDAKQRRREQRRLERVRNAEAGPDLPLRMATTIAGDVKIEPGQKRVRAYLGGELVADSTNVTLVFEHPHWLQYWFPEDAVRAEVLVASGTHTDDDPFGAAQHFTVRTARDTAVDAARVYPDSPVEALRGLVRLEWDAMDAWFEEDEQVHGHPKNPYHRVDVLQSSRHVQVKVGDMILADTHQPRVLFETGLPVRYYVPKVDVRMDLLEETATESHCPYKGHARYWSVRTGDGGVVEDAVWSYPYPLPEAFKVADLVAFWKVDIIVDGVPVQ